MYPKLVILVSELLSCSDYAATGRATIVVGRIDADSSKRVFLLK